MTVAVTNSHTSLWEEQALALKERPGEWAMLRSEEVPGDRVSLARLRARMSNLVVLINTGRLRPFAPKGSFRAVHRLDFDSVNLYVVYDNGVDLVDGTPVRRFRIVHVNRSFKGFCECPLSHWGTHYLVSVDGDCVLRECVSCERQWTELI